MVPALEVAIGLAVLFFVISLASSSIVEIVGTAFKLRANGLERTVRTMLGEPIADGQVDVATAFVESATVKALRESEAAWTILGRRKRSRTIKVEERRKVPARMPARAFAEGLVDVLTDVKSSAGAAGDFFAKLPPELQARLRPMLDETGQDLVALKARLEQWFDDSMQGLEEMYRRWAKKILFIVGLGLTLVLNASAIHVAERLWTDPLAREAVVASVAAETPPTAPARSFTEVAEQISRLDEASLPVGWDGVDLSASWVAASVVGWLLTALLVTLGAPFWYDLLTRLLSARRGSSPAAGDDPASATTQIATETSRGTRLAYDQGEGTRSVAPTPPSNPADRLFEALPTR